MLALWLERQEIRLRDDVPPPEPLADETRVRVTLAGICNTDIELLRGYYPFAGIPGHEFVGVAENGPLSGKRVVGEINASCGDCAMCRAGRRTHCQRRTVLGIVNRHGAFAELLSLPSRNLHAVPDAIPDEAAIFAEPLAAALQIREQVALAAGDRVLVVGDGKLGQLIARAIAPTGCDLTAVGRHENKLALLRGAGVGTRTADAIRDGAFDVVVECTGNPDGFALARRAVRPRGTIVMKSTYAGELTLNASSLVVDEITLVGSRCGPFAPALELLASGAVDVTPLLHARYSLREAIAAFEHARRPGVLKVAVAP